MGLEKLLRDNGLSPCLLLIFLSFLGQTVAGHRQCNDTQREHNSPTVSYSTYLSSGEFLNWQHGGELSATIDAWKVLLDHARSIDQRQVLVRIPSKLADRVSIDRHPGDSFDIPTATGSPESKPVHAAHSETGKQLQIITNCAKISLV